MGKAGLLREGNALPKSLSNMNYLQREIEEGAILEREGWNKEDPLLKKRVTNGLMTPERYYIRLLDSKEPDKVRLQVVIHYFTNGFNKSFTAEAFGTTTKTVRKLVERYKKKVLMA